MADSSPTDVYPIWQRNLVGTGLKVQVADTGVDLAHCHFADPTQPRVGPSHRKVASFLGVDAQSCVAEADFKVILHSPG